MLKRVLTPARLVGVAATAILVAVLLPLRGTASEFSAGVCDLELEADWNGSNRIDVSTPTAGTCTIDGESGIAVLNGFVQPTSSDLPFDCTQALGHSNDGSFSFKKDGKDWVEWTNAVLTVSKMGDAVSISLVKTGTSSVTVVGQYVQSPAAVQVCSQGTNPVTWTGAIAFEDPVLESGS